MNNKRRDLYIESHIEPFYEATRGLSEILTEGKMEFAGREADAIRLMSALSRVQKREAEYNLEAMRECKQMDQFFFSVSRHFTTTNNAVLYDFLISCFRSLATLREQLSEAIKAIENKNSEALKKVIEDVDAYRKEAETQTEQDKKILDALTAKLNGEQLGDHFPYK